MKTWWNGLSMLWKVIVIAAILIAAVVVFDYFTGYVREAKNWLFDRNQAEITANEKALEDENTQLRNQNIQLIAKAEQDAVKEKALDAQIEAIGGQLKTNADATKQASDEIQKEIEITEQPVDAIERCNRLKQKLLDLKIKSASEMECTDVQ